MSQISNIAMFNLIKKKIRSIKSLYFFWCKINYFLEKRNINVFFYNSNKLIELNNSIYKKFDLKFDPTFNNSYRETIPIKYKIFKSLNEKLDKKSLKILEIGTFDGLFTKYLSEIFSESEIITIDLPHNDTRFVQSYGREEKSDTFLVNRSKNIKNSNITFIEMDSLNILNKFSENFFDIIFVDGDHRDPVVSKDIFNSYKLLKNNGFLLVDDIYLNFTHREKIERMEKIVGELPSIDGYNALERLSKEEKKRVGYLAKFYGPKNFFYNPKFGILKK